MARWWLPMVLVAALLVTGCGGGSPRVEDTSGREIAMPTATPGETVSPAATAGTASPGATAPATGTATATAEPTSAAAASATPASDAGDLPGVPYSTADVRAAVRAASRVFDVLDREPLCPSTSVPEVAFWAAPAGGSDYGPVWALWIYPDIAARQRDWDTGPSGVRARTSGCDLPTGAVFWHANAVLAFVTWRGPDGDSVSDPARRASDDAVVDAFLGLN